ncbi:MAG TPA: 2OG-Fe(II) oxygenase [Nannocystaceae bacterium]|nr:2OG-Fe(II) oxygenase [Nannocystaceae bacterium]
MTTALRREFPGGERLADDPLIHRLDDLLTPAECAHVIAAASPAMRRSQVSGATGGTFSAGRTSERTWLRHDTDPTIRALVDRIAAVVGLPSGHAEPLQVIHYGAGQEYRGHFDAYDLSTEKGRLYTARGGQRLVTALVYLNEVEAGGETAFPRLGLRVSPRPGTLLIFHNCVEGTTTVDPRSYHLGAPPERGEKWAFNLWFHERDYQSERR